MSTAPSLETLVTRILRGAAEPLTAEQILEQVPAEALQEHSNPKQ